jgi:hypothetical protein
MNYDLVGQLAIAEFVGVSDETIKRWKRDKPHKFKSIKILGRNTWRANSKELKAELEKWAK